MATLIAAEYKQFEDIKHADDNGVEFWYARELASVLDYTQWRNFTKVIDKAMLSCQNSGFECADHFVDVSKMVQRSCSFFLKSRFSFSNRSAIFRSQSQQ